MSPTLLKKIVFFLRGSSKVEEAVESYQRAANLLKMSKKWSAAGNAFCQAANLNSKTGSKHDAASNYIDASNCYKKSDPTGKHIFSFIKTLFELIHCH